MPQQKSSKATKKDGKRRAVQTRDDDDAAADNVIDRRQDPRAPNVAPLSEAGSIGTARSVDMVRLSDQFNNLAMSPISSTNYWISGREQGNSSYDQKLPLNAGVTGRYPPPAGSNVSDNNFKERNRAFFKPGKVLVMVWAEPARHSRATTSHLFAGHWGVGPAGENVHQKPRRFVVIKQMERHCIALAITTHNGRGVSALGNDTKWQYSIIYTGREVPPLLPGEHARHHERPMQPTSIRVLPDLREDTLSLESRLNYGKLYTIEYNVAVRPFGVISPNHQQAFFRQFRAVFDPDVQGRQDQQPSAGAATGPTARQPSANAVAPSGGEVSTARARLATTVREVAARLAPSMPDASADEIYRAALDIVRRRMAQDEENDSPDEEND